MSRVKGKKLPPTLYHHIYVHMDGQHNISGCDLCLALRCHPGHLCQPPTTSWHPKPSVTPPRLPSVTSHSPAFELWLLPRGSPWGLPRISTPATHCSGDSIHNNNYETIFLTSHTYWVQCQANPWRLILSNPPSHPEGWNHFAHKGSAISL